MNNSKVATVRKTVDFPVVAVNAEGVKSKPFLMAVRKDSVKPTERFTVRVQAMKPEANKPAQLMFQGENGILRTQRKDFAENTLTGFVATQGKSVYLVLEPLTTPAPGDIIELCNGGF